MHVTVPKKQVLSVSVLQPKSVWFMSLLVVSQFVVMVIVLEPM